MCRCLDVFVKEVVAERVTTFVDGPLQSYKTVVYLQCVYNEVVSSFFSRFNVYDSTVRAYDSASVGTCRSCIGLAFDTAFNA